MKFERSELGALFSKLRTAVPEVRAVGTDDAGILLSGSNAYATNLELSVRAGLSKPVEQDVVVPPRGVDFISGTVAPEISIEADKGILTVKSGTARARLNTTPAENYPEFSGPGNDAKRCIVGGQRFKLGNLQSPLCGVEGRKTPCAPWPVLLSERRGCAGNLCAGWIPDGDCQNQLHS